MSALATDRPTHERAGTFYDYPWEANAQFYKGQLVAKNAAGNAEAFTAAASKVCVGVSQEQKLATAVAAAGTINVKTGCFKFANSVGDALTKANVGGVCYGEDDQTVCATGTSKSVVGYVVQIDSDGVWAMIHAPANANPSAALLVANDLSDVNDAPTARSNIAANKVILAISAPTLVSSSADVIRIVSPVAGDIAKIYTVLDGALAVGDVTLTAKIGATPVTDGVVTITEAGSAAGDVDVATPSAAKTVAAGDVISLTMGGTNTADVRADVTIYIET